VGSFRYMLRFSIYKFSSTYVQIINFLAGQAPSIYVIIESNFLHRTCVS
jgi:hypothetical protein